MVFDDTAYEHLRRAIEALARTAQSDLPPPERLELLCVQIGTVEYWSTRLVTVAPAAEGLKTRRHS